MTKQELNKFKDTLEKKQAELLRVIVNREGILVDRMALLSVSLADSPESESIPDFGGRFIAEIAEATFEAAAEGNVDRFRKLFLTLGLSSMKLTEKMRGDIEMGNTSSPALHAFVAVVAQFIDIAGYACVFSELHGKPALWEETKTVLDGLFKADAARSALYLKGILGLSAFGGLGIPHMSTFRQWRRSALNQQLVPFVRDNEGGSHLHRTVIHQSLIVTEMGSGAGFGPEGLDLFAVQYLHKELGVPVEELQYRAQVLARTLDREARRRGNR